METELDIILSPLWEKILKNSVKKTSHHTDQISWCLAVTLALPSSWPLNKDTQLIYYGYGQGMRFSLMDAVIIAKPWVKILQPIHHQQGHRESPKVEVISQILEELGIQGVRPVVRDTNEAEIRINLEKNMFIAAQEFNDPNSALSHELYAFYRNWLRFNGVIINELRSLHTAFFEMLSRD